MLAIQLINTIKPGGAENVAYNYSKILKKIGLDTIIIGKQDSKEYEKIISSAATINHSLTKKALQNADAIFIHSNINLLKLLFLRSNTKHNARVFYIQHLRYPPLKFILLSIIINFICTDFIQITPITENPVRRYIKVHTHKIINFHINKYQHTQHKEIRNKVRQELNVSNEKKTIVFSAIFKPGKGLKDAIELATLMQNDKRYYFLIIGDGEESSIVKAYDQSNLKWIGRVSDVERYLIAGDIYFFPSRFKHEMMPMALIEAINSDKYIAAFRTEINDFLLNGKTFTSLSQVITALNKNELPIGFKHYDENYAIMKFSHLFERDI